MKVYIFLIIQAIFLLTSCTTTSTRSPPEPKTKPLTKSASTIIKDPMLVKLYTANNPSIPYVILGTETVSKFNYVGIKRQKAHIQDVMRDLAANLGGDGVINIKDQQTSISGTIIAYKNTATKSQS